MQHRLSGTALCISGLVACPCHLVITLPLALSLLAGTAAGAWLATHQSLVFLVATVYFVVALGLGYWLWSAPSAPGKRALQSVGNACPTCPPLGKPGEAPHDEPLEVLP